MYMTHLECARDGSTYDGEKLHNLSDVGAPLLACYDLEKAAETLRPEALQARPPNMWRYREVMPIRSESEIVSLGEGFTPLHRAERLGTWAGFSELYIKDESVNPTGSFKARGLSAAVTAARARGAEGERLAGLDRQTPEIQIAALFQGGAQVVFLAHRDAAAGQYQIRRVRQQGVQLLAGAGPVVRQPQGGDLAETALPQWVYGMRTSAWDGEKILTAACMEGRWELLRLDLDNISHKH